mmetsp:Transcript_572/g.880  ORF Transcript_572/g.880 Transcript_572/m.880 type:complete len:453 (+) Transcript_572:2751-4109(+)
MRFSTTNIQLTSDVNNLYLLLVCSIAASAQFATGYELGSVNAVYYQYSRIFTSMFICILLAGLCIGSLIVKYLSPRFGRRMLLIVSSAILLIGTSVNIINSDETTFIARFIDGVACGIGTTVAPIYIKEITPSEVSGKFGGLNQVFFTAGICAAASMQLLKYQELNGLFWWQVGYIILISLIIIHVTLLITVLPDSPHWHFDKGNKEKAKDIIRKIFKNPFVVVDKKIEIKEEVRVDPESNQGIYITLIIAVASATCGFDFALNFSITLYVTDSTATAIIFAFSLLLTTILLSFIVIIFSDRFYRKAVFVAGFGCLSVISFIHGILKLGKADTDASHIVLVTLFFCVFQSTIGPFFWIYIPEVLKIKDICYPMACLWFAQLVCALFYNFKHKPHADEIFYMLFGSFSLISALLISKFAIETKGVPWTVVVSRLVGDSSGLNPSMKAESLLSS